MSESRPLTRERRAEVEAFAKAPFVEIHIHDKVKLMDDFAMVLHMMADLARAEAYWRNAVKNAEHVSDEGDCNFLSTAHRSVQDCAADNCPFVEAQE